MKHTLMLIICSMLTWAGMSQQVISMDTIYPETAYDNILVKNLDHDSLSSTFIIWVKSSVREHYHREHTEVVIVLEGEGTMVLDGKESFIGPGDYIFIPKGTLHSVKVKGGLPMKVLSIQSPHFDGSDRTFSE